MNLKKSLWFILRLSVALFFRSENVSAADSQHWTIEVGTHQYSDVLPDPRASEMSDKEKEKLAKRARKHGLDVQGSQLLFMDHLSSPTLEVRPARNEANCRGAANAQYCARLDAIFAAQMEMRSCPILRTGMFSAFTGVEKTYIDQACVQNAIGKAMSIAKSNLVNDRNLDWAAGALALAANCESPKAGYCDVEDMAIRNSFTADLLNDLKKGPRPISWQVNSRILMNNEPIALESVPVENNSSESMETIAGEFRVSIAAQNALPGKMIVEYRDQNLGLIYPITGTLNEFARDRAQELCSQKRGTLIADDQDGNGSIHTGMLRARGSIFVFYIGACKIKG